MNAPTNIQRTLPKRNGGGRIPLFLLAALVLAVSALIFALSAKPAPAASTLINGDFEYDPNGPDALHGWTTSTGDYSSVEVTNQGALPIEGRENHYAYLTSRAYTTMDLTQTFTSPAYMSQSFSAEAGDMIGGWAVVRVFESRTVGSAAVIISTANGQEVATPYKRYGVLYDGSAGAWTQWTYTFEQSGDYTVIARADNTTKTPWTSQVKLGVDEVTITSPQPDTTPPHFTSVPEDISVDATSTQGAYVNYDTPTAHDDGDAAAATVTCEPASGSLFRNGTTTVTCTATDSKGNTAQRSFLVTVRDVIAPSIVQRSPGEDQIDVPKTANITVTFSEEVQGIDDTTFKLERMTRKGFEPVEAAPPSTELITDQGEQVTKAALDPTRSLHGGNWYRVTITSSITDMVGNSLAGTKWDFKVN